MSRPVILAVLAAAICIANAAQASGAPPGLDDPRRHDPAPKLTSADLWIVELDAPPLATYEGGGQRDRATAPRATGRKLDVRSADARAWRAELDQRERAVLARPGLSVRPVVRYRTTLNGFAAHLTADEVAMLRRAPGVRRVMPNETLRVSQEPGSGAAEGLAGSEAELLGLPDGLWKRLGGPRQAGRGVIVGIVDSGITPEAESFAPRDLEPPALWNGACESGEEFSVTSCNDKLIGARYFTNGFDPGRLPEGTFLSPRDEVGHGTHVAAIAAGDESVDPEIAGNDLGVERIAGVAPAAHIASYKVVIWTATASWTPPSPTSRARARATNSRGPSWRTPSPGSTSCTCSGPASARCGRRPRHGSWPTRVRTIRSRRRASWPRAIRSTSIPATSARSACAGAAWTAMRRCGAWWSGTRGGSRTPAPCSAGRSWM